MYSYFCAIFYMTQTCSRMEIVNQANNIETGSWIIQFIIRPKIIREQWFLHDNIDGIGFKQAAYLQSTPVFCLDWVDPDLRQH